MSDDTKTVVKDKPKEGEKPTEKATELAPKLLDKEGAEILRTNGNKAKTDLPAVELFDSSRNGGKESAPKPESIKHDVKKGDTLSHIVEKHLPKKEGESTHDYNKRLYGEVADVARKNGIADPDKIKPGQKIELTDHSKPAAKPGDTVVKPVETVVKPVETVVKPGETAVVPGDTTVKPAEQPVEPAKKPVDEQAMRKQADILYGATEGDWFGTNEDLTKEVLKNLKEDERKVLNDVYKEKYGKDIDQVLRSEMSGQDLTESLAHLNAKDKVTGVDRGKAERVAEAIDNAANGGFLGMGTDKKAIEEQLKGKTAEELKAIDEAFTARTGHSLKDELKDELGGSDLTKLTALAEGKNDDAARINATLEEHKEWGIGARSNANCEKDLRDTLSTLNSQQIAELDKTYQERYGKSLSEVLKNDDNLPQETKDALAIYLKGTDKMTAADTLAISDIALKSQNLEMFQEAFRGASPEARAQFLQGGGEQRVNEAFGTDDAKHAMDYAKTGKLDAAIKIGDNTSFFGDNEAAIEASLNQMTAAEKQSYAAGQKLAGADAASLNPADKANLEYYNKVHTALGKAGDEREVAKWEDMIATGKDGSLVTRLAAHGGMFDDGMNKVLGTIEDMPKEDWERLKSDPEYRKKVEATLAIDLSDSEMARAREALDKKMAAGTFEGSKEAQRSVVDAIKDETGFFNNNEDNIIRALEKMTPDEQKRYREDPAFKKQLDAEVASAMDAGSERDAAMRVLDKVAKGEKPEADIVAKLEMHSTNFNVDEAKVVADLEESFRKDPTLRDRLNNPQTAEDKAMAEKFNSALHKALYQDEYDKFAKPLLETGRIPFAVKAELYQGLFDDDEKAVYDALKKDRATPEDWKELIANPEKTLGFMSAEEREVALNIARQKGEMKPEDELRAAMLGAGTDEAKIKEVLQSFDPAKLQAAKDAYEVKYGSNLTGDALEELGGADKVEAARELRGPQTAREAYNEARTEVYESADGVGKFIVKHWDGTSEMTSDQLEQYSKAMGDYSKSYQEMPVEARQQFEDNLYKSLELYKKSEGAAADAIVDGAIIAAGVGGAAFTGGVSLSLLAATSVGGAMFKIGAKSAILGADYDFASAQVISDGATGAIDAATIFLGPAQAAQMLKLGEKSAVTAARTVLSEVDNIAVAGGKQLLKEGSEATIQKELAEQVAVAISNGAKGVDDKAIARIAEKVATDAADVPQVQQIIKANLAKAIETEAGAGLKASMREYALNTGAGAVGGSLSGGVRGGIDGESLEAMAQQAAMGGLAGGTMAGAFTAAFKGMGKGLSALRHGDTPDVHLRGSVEVNSVSAAAEAAGAKLDGNGRITEVTTPDGKMAFDYHRSGDHQGEVKKVTYPNGNVYRSEDGVKWTVKDPTAPGGKYEVNGTMKVDADGTVHWQPEGGDKSLLRADGSRVKIDAKSGDEVTTDVLGYVRGVKTEQGNVKFDYDHDGHVQRASFDNGSTIEVNADGKVVQTRADGTTVELDGKAAVNKDGQLSITPADGRPQILTPDGGRVQFDGDSKRITDAWTATGAHYHYEFDSTGQLDLLRMPDGKSMKRDPEGGWETFDKDGKSTGVSGARYEVQKDGALSYSQGDRSVTYGLDGHSRVYDANNELVVHRGIDGIEIKPKAELSSVDGRPVEFQEKVREKFPLQWADNKQQSLELVSTELKSVRALDADGKPTSAYESLMSDKTLTDAQKQNILDNMSEIREHFASYRVGDRMHPDPEVNWIHTQGEMAKVLEVGRKAGLKPDELEDALLASMYSDSVKFAFPPPKGADANFFTHHLDGALAAHEALTRKGFPPERVDRIVQAIKEHQIAPPEFMGMLYLNAKITPSLGALLKDGKITQARFDELSAVLKDMTVKGDDGISRLKPIAQVNDWPKVRNADGSWEVALTPDQRELLKLAGVDSWTVPVNPIDTPGFKQLPKAEQDALVSKFKIASTLIDGDGVDNYATLGGASKIVAIRGPGTNFKDGNVWQSIDSIDASYKDTYSVLSPKGREVADASLAQRNALLNDEQSGIKAQMTEWLQSKGLKPEDVVYFQKDGTLKYPGKPSDEEALRITQLQKQLEAKTGSPAEIETLKKELFDLQHLGMSADDVRQFELAGEVRAKMTDLLRSGHRTDGSLPGNFPVGKVERPSHLDWLEPKPATIPEATGQIRDFGDGTIATRYKDGTLYKGSDGSVMVVNVTNDTVHTYNPAGKITDATGVKGRRAFTYDADGKLSSVHFENGAVVRRENDVWMGQVKQSDGTSKDDVWFRGNIVADGDGSIRYVHGTGSHARQTVDSVNGTKFTMNGDRVDYSSADLKFESAKLSRVSREAFAAGEGFERFDKLIKDFDVEATKRGLSDEKKALLYLQVNRLLEANPVAVLSQADRNDLAEQLMAHAIKPSTVDQGMSSTCNVTTLEARNYAKDPDKNAQLLADLAINGKFITADGHTVEMASLPNGLKPDFEARRALRLQHGDGDKFKRDGSRDWSSQLTEGAMVNAYWQGRSHLIHKGQRVEVSYSLAYNADGSLIGKVHDGAKVQGLFNKDGEHLASFKAGDQAYNENGKLLKNVDPESLVYTQYGGLRGALPEKKIDKVFDSAGNRLTDLTPGITAYDEKGKLVMRMTKPGEIRYEKSLNAPIGGEKVKYFDGENWVQLRDRGGEKMDAPGIFTPELEGVNTQATGVSDGGYMLTFGKRAQQYFGQRDVSTVDELADAIMDLEKTGKLPAVMQVHTARPPFSPMLGIESAVGLGGGWHVINIQGYDPVTRKVRFTNQWGSGADRLEEGYSIDKLFKSMQEPAMHKFMQTTTGKLVKGTVAAGALVYGGVQVKDRIER